MDLQQHAIDTAIEILAIADGLEPDRPSHLLMNEADLRGLLEAAGLGAAEANETVHHAFHEHGVAKVAALANTWAPASRCAQCGGRVAPIVYGMPTVDLGELAQLGVISIGGCMVEEDQPDFTCMSCGATWR